MFNKIISVSILICLSITIGRAERLGQNFKDMLTVKKISFPCKNPPIRLVEKMLDSMEIDYYQIDKVNWPGYPYKPDVKFRIAYSQDEIYIQYVVKERYIRAIFSEDEGSQPYKDSCVEFFIIPADDNIYYNLELNCIGVGTFAGGPDRKNRHRFGKEITSLIRRDSSLGGVAFDTKEGEFDWKITIALPVKLFSLSKVEPLAGRVVKANFYKCGDDLPQQHYLSWWPILSEKPNFHTPEYFGALYFEK